MSTGALYLQQVINGLSLGAMYALLALGFTLVYGILELINFAHFNVFMVASFVALATLEMLGLSGQSHVLTGLPLVGALLLAFVVTMLAAGLLGVAVERIALRPLRGVSGTAAMITTIGVSYILFNLVMLTVGANSHNFPNPMPVVRWELGGGAVLQLREVLIWIVSLVLLLGLHFFASRTRLGKAMRATAQDRDAAQLMGIDIDRTIAATFFIGAVLAGAGGAMYGLSYNTAVFDLGFSAGLVAFTAAVFGGIGNIYGAAIGGLVLGLVRTMWDGYFDSAWSDVVVFAILILVLVFRPTGILGMRVPEK